MENLLEKIEDVLEKEIDMHDRLIGSSQGMNKALRDGDVSAIDKERALHDEAFCNVEKLESQRQEICMEAAAALGIERANIKMPLLLDKIPASWRERLGALQQNLKGKIAELSSLTVSNRILIEEGLRMISNTFSIIRQAERRFDAYGTRGQSLAGSSMRSVINRTM